MYIWTKFDFVSALLQPGIEKASNQACTADKSTGEIDQQLP